jgi:microcystin-dependent protein
MAEPYIGEIKMFGINFAPRNWAFCNGQLMSIAQNTALFAILGVTYGGDGRVTFGLPDFRGRVPIHWGQGPGLSPVGLGDVAGSETETLTFSELATHTHAIAATSDSATGNRPGGNQLAAGVPITARAYAPTGGTLVDLATETVLPYQNNPQPHDNMQPFLPINFCIALQGSFPPRN